MKPAARIGLHSPAATFSIGAHPPPPPPAAVCDAEFKPDLTAKIASLIQRYAPDKRWHIDSTLAVLVQVGQLCCAGGGGGCRGAACMPECTATTAWALHASAAEPAQWPCTSPGHAGASCCWVADNWQPRWLLAAGGRTRQGQRGSLPGGVDRQRSRAAALQRASHGQGAGISRQHRPNCPAASSAVGDWRIRRHPGSRCARAVSRPDGSVVSCGRIKCTPCLPAPSPLPPRLHAWLPVVHPSLVTSSALAVRCLQALPLPCWTGSRRSP